MTSLPAESPSRSRVRFTLAVLFGLNFMNFYDRQIVGAVGERIKQDWHLSDSQLSGLTVAFILLYAIVGIPFGRVADIGRRRFLLAGGAFVWSLFTGLSGLAWNITSLFAFRLGVGVGEASCAPCANSLLGDLYPRERRGRAISWFMFGLPLGTAASYLLSGWIVELTGGWRSALFVAAVPGILLSILATRILEPVRGHADGAPARPMASAGLLSTIREILAIPSMRWIIVSGALLNINMYALAAFLVSYLVRYHGLAIGGATQLVAGIVGLGGAIGLFGGGWLGDQQGRINPAARLTIPAVALGIAAPVIWASLQLGRGNVVAFGVLLLLGHICHYCYYGTVYAAIQEVVEPIRRGMAMAVYFVAFYFATALGLLGFGRLSDFLRSRAATGGAGEAEALALGLHGAMYAIPICAAVLALVLWVGSRRMNADHRAMLQRVSAA